MVWMIREHIDQVIRISPFWKMVLEGGYDDKEVEELKAALYKAADENPDMFIEPSQWRDLNTFEWWACGFPGAYWYDRNQEFHRMRNL